MANCKQQLRTFVELACTFESGGVNALAFVDEAKAKAADADTSLWSTPSFWTSENYGGDIVIHDEVSGSYSDADSTGPGRGNQQERLVGKVHTLVCQVDSVKNNNLYWDDLNIATNYRVVWVGDDYNILFVSPVEARISAKLVQAQELSSILHWEVTCVWSDIRLPQTYNVPTGIFN
jgi:hypothetical protein